MAKYSLIVPIYRSYENLPDLMVALDRLYEQLNEQLEVVLVNDGSPDDSLCWLAEHLPRQRFSSRLLSHSRNFGAFAAIRTGLRHARGEFMAVMAADLQEPPEFVRQMFEVLDTEPVDVVIGVRQSRQDPLVSKLFSRLYWGCYRRYVQKDMPPGGMDIFGCNKMFCDELVAFDEANSSLIGQVLWLGYRRKLLPYHRQARTAGKSAWSFRKKVRYLLDSVFAFTDLPITLLFGAGLTGLLFAVLLGALTLFARMTGMIEVPGYTTLITVICLFSGLNLLGLAIIGMYVWRAYENTKTRPLGLVAHKEEYQGHDGSNRIPAPAKSV